MKIVSGKQFSYSIDNSDKNNTVKSGARFGDTFVGTQIETGNKVIIRRIPESTKNEFVKTAFANEPLLKFDTESAVLPFDFFSFEGYYYQIRKYIEGETLQRYIVRNNIKSKGIILLTVKLLSEIAKVHEKGFIHGDIRSSNILINAQEKVFIIDFGLCRDINAFATYRKPIPFALYYSPPEQVLNIQEAVGFSSDLFAVGVVLYEMLAGNMPWYHSNPELLMHMQINLEIDNKYKLNKSIFSIIQKACAKHAFKTSPNKINRELLIRNLQEANNKRYNSALDMKMELENLIPQL